MRKFTREEKSVDRTSPQKQNTGNAGEYYIAAVLSALDFTVTVTLGRAERYDIIAVHPKGRAYKLSIKTRYSQETSAFTLSQNDERNAENDLFYVFVRLHQFKIAPEYWVIPSKRVANLIHSSHLKWLSLPGRAGRKHIDNPIRKLPLKTEKIVRHFYPLSWKKELKRYYMNFSRLK